MTLLLSYLLDFVTNIIPLFMPPTWLLLSFFRIHYGLPVWLLAPGGAVCSTAGRCLLALGSRRLGGRFLPEKERKNVTDLGVFIRRKRLSFLGILFYAFGPIPSSHLFIAAGLAKLNLKVVAAAFFLGRLVSYTVLVAGAGAVGDQLIPLFKEQFSGWIAYATAAFAVIFVIVLVKINWRKTLGRWWPTDEDDGHTGELLKTISSQEIRR
jgi:membrane protein YqaA with SNARE-associated domain